jgi:hypothetical protein
LATDQRRGSNRQRLAGQRRNARRQRHPKVNGQSAAAREVFVTTMSDEDDAVIPAL